MGRIGIESEALKRSHPPAVPHGMGKAGYPDGHLHRFVPFLPEMSRSVNVHWCDRMGRSALRVGERRDNAGGSPTGQTGPGDLFRCFRRMDGVCVPPGAEESAWLVWSMNLSRI